VDLLGSGIAFPLQADHRGALALASGDEDIRQAMILVLRTSPGERPMRPEFGCPLRSFVFDAIDPYTIGRLRDEVLAALERWEPRIDVLDVDIDVGDIDHGRLLLDIAYVVRATNDARNLVYPFYLVPAGEAEE
jgi:phage baseplate assembly protein W